MMVYPHIIEQRSTWTKIQHYQPYPDLIEYLLDTIEMIGGMNPNMAFDKSTIGEFTLRQ